MPSWLLRPPSWAPSSSNAELGAMSGRRRLAIAFDSPQARDALFSRLDGAGVELDCFDDGKALLEHCRTHAPDLVVLALSGGSDSPARGWPNLAETPLVAIVESEADVAQALRVGQLAGLVVGPLSKPLVEATIQVALRQLDRIHELQEKLAKAMQIITDH
jgi:AmiR/NasT family two-component response regulator